MLPEKDQSQSRGDGARKRHAAFVVPMATLEIETIEGEESVFENRFFCLSRARKNIFFTRTTAAFWGWGVGSSLTPPPREMASLTVSSHAQPRSSGAAGAEGTTAASGVLSRRVLLPPPPPHASSRRHRRRRRLRRLDLLSRAPSALPSEQEGSREVKDATTGTSD